MLVAKHQEVKCVLLIIWLPHKTFRLADLAYNTKLLDFYFKSKYLAAFNLWPSMSTNIPDCSNGI